MAERQEVVVKFASFKYDAGLPVRQVARRGETIEVTEEDYERGQRLGAFVDSADDLDQHGDLPTLGDDADESEIAHWMRSATLSDVQAVLAESPGPDLVAALAAGEKARGSEQRPEVLEALEAAQAEPDLTEGSVAQVLERVGEDPEAAAAALEAEQAKGEDARKSLVEGLQKVIAAASSGD
ncbi:MAG TPA: hypothetical protein VIP58_17465 [Nocardioides sp.]